MFTRKLMHNETLRENGGPFLFVWWMVLGERQPVPLRFPSP